MCQLNEKKNQLTPLGLRGLDFIYRMLVTGECRMACEMMIQ